MCNWYNKKAHQHLFLWLMFLFVWQLLEVYSQERIKLRVKPVHSSPMYNLLIYNRQQAKFWGVFTMLNNYESKQNQEPRKYKNTQPNNTVILPKLILHQLWGSSLSSLSIKKRFKPLSDFIKLVWVLNENLYPHFHLGLLQTEV